MPLRDHEPKKLDRFNGLWDQGEPEECPPDHFRDCENIRFIGKSSFGTRFGVDKHQTVVGPLGKIAREYNYITPSGSTLIVLTYDPTLNEGKIFHVVNPGTVFGPLLTLTGMEDFGFVPYAGRAYITPFKTYTEGGLKLQLGLDNEFLYVYLGAGSPARKAGGNPPAGTLTIANGAAGFTDPGLHLFGVVFETNTGYLTPPSAFKDFTTSSNLSVSFSNIPISAQSFVVKRHIVATKVITNYNGNTTGYQYFFIPNATLNDNVTTTLPNISFFDADLLDDASHLLDNFSEIPAGVGLSLYHNRLCLYGEFDNRSVARVSAVGEPEAISQIDGLLIIPPDGNPITNAQELRDILYVCKRNRTVAFTDNDDVPSSWPLTIIDQAIGASVHGIATVMDSGATSVNYLIVASYKGLVIFTGIYILPELSWKISNFWRVQNKNLYGKIQIVNDPVTEHLYCVLPDQRILIGNYSNGLDPKGMRWAPWSFDFKVNTIALVNVNELIIGAGL